MGTWKFTQQILPVKTVGLGKHCKGLKIREPSSPKGLENISRNANPGLSFEIAHIVEKKTVDMTIVLSSTDITRSIP